MVRNHEAMWNKESYSEIKARPDCHIDLVPKLFLLEVVTVRFKVKLLPQGLAPE